MRVLDPLLFLAGHHGAIERIAATRHAWVVGAILVLSAGIARNYDHLDLLREPEWFIGPYAASLVSIVFIFCCLKGPLQLSKVGPEGKQLGAFLTFAWMTAPCAWLYGIPVESMTDIVTATKWNIAFLAIVSLWRVFLMTRAVAVLTGVKPLRAFVLVLTPAAFEAMVGSTLKGMSLVGIMGGVRLPPHTELLREASGFVASASFWLFVAGVVACWIVKGTAVRPLHRERSKSPGKAVAVAAAALAAWGTAALPYQPAVQNRRILAELIQQGAYAEAVAFASPKQRSEFPRHHDIPPGWEHRPALELLEASTAATPSWLRDEWTRGAIESFKGYPAFSREFLTELEERHPKVASALRDYAKELKEREESLDWRELQWLKRYERAAGPDNTSEGNPRFHPEQVPPAGE